MEIGAADLRRAWQVLRRTRRRLAPPIQQAKGAATGYIPSAAGEQLAKEGWSVLRAEGAVHDAVLWRFTAFANSWDAYIDQRGWLIDLLAAPECLRERIASRFQVAPLIDAAEAMRVNQRLPQQNLQQWEALFEATTAIEQPRETGEHPAGAMMEAKYNLHHELAKAIMLHSRIEPWWVHLALSGAWLICGLVFLQALINPLSPAFENESVGGVGPLHYIVLPLFMLMFMAAQAWLIRVRPQRQKQWRDQLERYSAAWKQDKSG